MKKILSYIKPVLGLVTLATVLGLVTARAQVAPSQGGMRAAPQDNDTTRGELASFDRFLDNHPEIAEQLRRDPSLVKNEDFVRDHRDLQEYLQQHPAVREEISEDPGRFLHQEWRFDRHEDMRDGDKGDNDRRDSDGRDNDTRIRELASWDRFMDDHPEIAEQLRKDPSLVRNQEFVEKHPALQEYLQQHPGVREEVTEDPGRFMHQEQRFDRFEDRRGEDRHDLDRRDNDTAIRELASFDRFMDSHPEIAEQLRKDPSVVNNREFAEKHPALQEYLQQHPGVREEITEDPGRFMHQEERFDRFEDRRGEDRRDWDRRDNDTTVRELASYDRFADSHPEIAEQLTKNPSLVRNEEFVRNHPALQEYLQQHPGVREEITENPNRFMRQEQRYDRFEDSHNRGAGNGEMASFGEFLGSHSSIAQELSRNPRLANDNDYRKTHPEFQQYLTTHPGVQEQLRQDPQAFMKSAQPMGSSPAAVPKTPTVDSMPKAPTVDPMPKPPTVDPIQKQ